jgi:flagellar motor switch protein FliN/FliY
VVIGTNFADFVAWQAVSRAAECRIGNRCGRIFSSPGDFMEEKSDTPKVNKLELESFDIGQQKSEQAMELKQLNDVSLELRAELDKTKITLREALNWKKDAIVTLDKLAGENVDIYVHDVRFASGEVLVVEDNFAVRLTELLSYIERVKLGLGRSAE